MEILRVGRGIEGVLEDSFQQSGRKRKGEKQISGGGI